MVFCLNVSQCYLVTGGQINRLVNSSSFEDRLKAVEGICHQKYFSSIRKKEIHKRKLQRNKKELL